jgi:hypothetical protein
MNDLFPGILLGFALGFFIGLAACDAMNRAQQAIDNPHLEGF